MERDLCTEAIGDLVSERPGRASLFQSLGIDFSGHGASSLAAACASRCLSLESVLSQLKVYDETCPLAAIDWRNLPLSALIEEILTNHHAYLRRALPRIRDLLEQAVEEEGDRHPELWELATLFGLFRRELQAHMHSEESSLFPILARCEQADSHIPWGSMMTLVEVHIEDHRDMIAALERMRAITRGYTAPSEVGEAHRAVMGRLAELEHDLHVHLHKENNILFARAAEACRRAASG